MIKKRVIPYFLLMAFPMGIGAGASTWITLPRIPLPAVLVEMTSAEQEESRSDLVDAAEPEQTEWDLRFPDFSAMHPLVVGSFSLLLCSGILLAAEPPKKT